ncbi:hypothetical protein BJY52DRAFT_1232597 [Lactarius psammicola]|nr:hypothetical protein BJY52DRAFT_1232597 [Lactarius psammicola]
MQSDIGSQSLSGGSQLSSTAPATAPAHPIDDVFEITQEDASILEEYIEEFKEGDADTRSRIIANVMAELYALRDGTVSFNKKDADRRVRKWFYNRYSPPERKYIKFTRKWSARNTFYHLHRDEVMLEAEQMSGARPGSQAFLGSLQDATTKIWSTLSAEDQQRYSNLATRWSDDAPPPHIQARMASSMSGKIIRDFQAQLFKTCGIRCVVLTAHEHENGSIITGIDEANNLLDDGTRFLKYCPNWKDAPLFREWQKYAKMCFRGGDVHTTQKGRPKTVKPPISIHIKSNGCPDIPAITNADGYNAKAVQAVLRDYVTTHIRYVSGKKKATIPWAKLSQDPSSWIKPECVPDGFQWADPSKLRIGDVFDLLNHWRQRKQDHLEPLIWMWSSHLSTAELQNRRQGHDTDVGGPNDSSDSESSPTSSSDDPSSSDGNHSALPNSDDNSTEDEESENFDLEVSPPHSLSSPQASGSFRGGRRYTSTPSSPIDTQRRSTPEMERTSSPSHILEERQERQGHDKDYDSGPDDSGAFQSSPQGSSDEPDHGKRRVKITERAKYMDTGRSVGGINTHFLQRDAPWFRQWCASGCSEMEENTPTYQSVEMYPGPMKGVQKWTCTLQSVEIPPSPVSSVQAVRPGWRSGYILTRLQKCTLVLPVCMEMCSILTTGLQVVGPSGGVECSLLGYDIVAYVNK